MYPWTEKVLVVVVVATNVPDIIMTALGVVEVGAVAETVVVIVVVVAAAVVEVPVVEPLSEWI